MKVLEGLTAEELEQLLAEEELVALVTEEGSEMLSDEMGEAVFAERNGGNVNIEASLRNVDFSVSTSLIPEEPASILTPTGILIEEGRLPDIIIVEHIKVGTFDHDASINDWGEVSDDNKSVVYTQDDITITTTVSDGELRSYNSNANHHRGTGIANNDANGIEREEHVDITIEGCEPLTATVTLSGLGGWFDETSRQATEVKLTAYGTDGEPLQTLGGYRESTEDTYTFNTDNPISSIRIESEGGNGNFVVQSLEVTALHTEQVDSYRDSLPVVDGEVFTQDYGYAGMDKTVYVEVDEYVMDVV